VKLGEGGFGTVYRAQHPVIGKKAAVKVLAREFSTKPEMVARFIDEARAVNQIRNKGIIDIFAFGSLADGRQYFVMELLEGMPLDAYIRQKGRLTPAETIPILRGVARAVDAAHQAGIAHRDLKPDNVFLVFDDDGSAHTKLLDFGIAKLVSEQSGRTRTGTPIGTPQYMSPEQARGIQVDVRTDVYSFGAMAYEMLTGSPPFDGASVMDILLKQISETPPAPSSRNPEIAALDAPLLRMLEKDPEKRPSSLTQGLDALAAAAGTPLENAAVNIDPSVRAGTARTLQATPAQTLVGSTTELAPPAKRTRATWIIVGVGAAVVISAIAVVGLRFRNKPPESLAVTTSVTATATPIPTLSSTASALPEEVAVRVDSQPFADIYDGSQKIGTTPTTLHLKRQQGTKRLTLRASGFLPQDVDLDTASDRAVSVALTADKSQPRSTVAPPPTKTSHVSTDLDVPFK
jgi:serine/threonine-protein kinase